MANRLEFDDDLMAAICRPSRGPQKAARVVLRVAVVLLVLAGLVAAGGFALFLSPFWPRPEPVAPMCTLLIDALRSGRLDEASSVCADAAPGRNLLLEENQRLALRFPDDAPEHVRRSSEAFLADVRDGLADAGLSCEAIRPLAFGGVRAKVFDPEHMRGPAVAMTGELYFAVGDAVYALELTARRCKDGYVVTDFWKCAPIDAAPATLESHSIQRFRAFKEKRPEAEGRILVQRPRHVYIVLEPPA